MIAEPEVGLGRRARSLVPLARTNHNIPAAHPPYTNRELLAAVRAEQARLEQHWSRLESYALRLEQR
jgi:hypothetical protein